LAAHSAQNATTNLKPRDAVFTSVLTSLETACQLAIVLQGTVTQPRHLHGQMHVRPQLCHKTPAKCCDMLGTTIATTEFDDRHPHGGKPSTSGDHPTTNQNTFNKLNHKQYLHTVHLDQEHLAKSWRCSAGMLRFRFSSHSAGTKAGEGQTAAGGSASATSMRSPRVFAPNQWSTAPGFSPLLITEFHLYISSCCCKDSASKLQEPR